MKYLATIKTNFREYEHSSVYLADDFESARDYLCEILSMIEDDTTNDRQKKFAYFLKNKVKNDKNISYGYGKEEYIAVDIVCEEEISKKIEEIQSEISALRSEIDAQRKNLR